VCEYIRRVQLQGVGGGGCLLQPLYNVITCHLTHVTAGFKHIEQSRCRDAARALQLTR